MIELTDYEKNLPSKRELILHWLYTNEINCADIINAYTSILNAEKIKLTDMLSKSDVYVSTLIDNKKNMIKKQRPYAIKYMLDNERLKGSQWYNELKAKQEFDKITIENDNPKIKVCGYRKGGNLDEKNI